MTKTLEERFTKVGNQENVKDPIVIAKYFNPTGIGYWFATEYDPKDKMFFGYVSLFGDYNDELGSFSLQELEDFRGKFGLGIERDLHFEEILLSKIIKEYTKA